MDRFDTQIKKALEHSVDTIKFTRKEAVHILIQQRKDATHRRPFFVVLKPIVAGFAACIVVFSMTLGALVWVPGSGETHLATQLIVAGELPFAAVQHMMEQR